MKNEDSGITRRRFVRMTAAAGATAMLGVRAWAKPGSDVPYRMLGHTGEKVSMVGIGGAHIGTQKDEQESIQIVRSALDRGINFLDNSWDYNGGASEVRMGKALRDGYRDKAFLMTKIDGRDKKTFNTQLDESLKRLQTDHVDLLQFHEVIRMDDPDRIFAPGGAMEAMQDARKAGKLRYIGFTGHKSPDIHLRMLQTADAHQFKFDTVQMPLNVMDAHYNSFARQVLPELVKRNLGVLGMKSMGSGVLLKSGVVEPVDCLHYAMNLPTSVVITGCDTMHILDQAIGAARSFRHLSDKQVIALLAKSAPAATEGQYELYKTSHHFDSTYVHPWWLG